MLLCEVFLCLYVKFCEGSDRWSCECGWKDELCFVNEKERVWSWWRSVWIACGKGVYMMCDKKVVIDVFVRLCNKILTWRENDSLCEIYLERLPLWWAQELHTLCFSCGVQWKNQRRVWVSWLCAHPKLLFLFCGFRQSGKHYRNIHTNVSSRVPTTRVKVLGITISAFLTWVKNLLTSFFVYFYFYCRKKCDALNYILDSLMCDKYISYAT
jgi:hypothetical protein